MSNTTPRVTVILTTHNRPQYLPEAAQSILTQTLRELELLIVDDASTNPETAQITNQLADQDPRVRIIRRNQNGGPAAARNTGAAQARAPLITFMDDDDICEPERLQKQAAFLDAHPHIASVACRKMLIDQKGRFIRYHSPPLSNIAICRPRPPGSDVEDGSIPPAIVGDAHIPFNHSTLVRSDCFAAIGGFRECYRAAEDHDITDRFQEKFAMAELPDVLYCYRQFKGDRVSTSQDNWRAVMAINISTCRRRTGKPDPMANGHLPDDEFLLTHFGELPLTTRLYLIGKFAGPSRRLIRKGKFSELRKLLTLAKNLCTSTNERRKLFRVHLWIVWWSIIFGKWRFWIEKSQPLS